MGPPSALPEAREDASGGRNPPLSTRSPRPQRKYAEMTATAMLKASAQAPVPQMGPVSSTRITSHTPGVSGNA